MIASSLLLAATLVAPAFAAAPADLTGRALPTLYALELIGTRGLSFGRFFDAAGARAAGAVPEAKAPPRPFESTTRRRRAWIPGW